MRDLDKTFNMLVVTTIIVAAITLYKGNTILNLILLGILCYQFVMYRKIHFLKLSIEHGKYEKALGALNGAVWEWFDDYNLLFISSRYKKVFKTENNIDSFDRLCEFIDNSYKEYIKNFFTEIIDKKIEDEFILEFKTIDIEGQQLYIECSGKGKIKDNKYELNGIFIDITEKKKQDELLRISERHYRRALEGSQDIMFYLKVDTGEYIINDREGLLFNNHEAQCKISNESWVNFILPKDRWIYIQKYEEFLREEKEYFSVEFRVESKKGEILWIKQKGKRILEDDGLYIYGSISNISDSKEKEMKIYYMSHFDEVTGIPNRRYFIEKSKKMLIRAKRDEKDFAIVFLDLDNFKYVNDTFGHDAGDILLNSFCDSLNSVVNEKCLLARFGGDEFIIAIGNIEAKEEVVKILNDILDTFNRPFKVAGKEIYCTVSIGVSFYRTDGKTVQALLKKADIAMYKAKANGKNRFCVFNKEVSDEINRELAVKRCLRNALDNGEIYFELQPKYWCKSKKIEGFECLARWKSSELGYVYPDEFILASESSGAIIDIGKYLIDDAFKKCKYLTSIIDDKFKVAINLSQVQIRDIELLEYIKEKIDEYDIDLSNIEFEVTESVIMKSAERNIEMLRKIKDLGATIALDDFGTGYSSLNYLKRLPIDKVKIDKSFVSDIGIDLRSEFIIEKIIELAHMLNLEVVAEGVETKNQLHYLEKVNCDIIQGYYFSKPLGFDKLVKGFTEDKTLVFDR